MAPKSRDIEATRAARFLSKYSRINMDGTVELHGDDMALLRAECFERDNFRCVTKGCETSLEWLQMDHIKSRGLHGRDDRIENVQTLCVNCHAKKHVRVRLKVIA